MNEPVPDTPDEATEQAAREHVGEIMFSSMDEPRSDCVLCQAASRLGIWAEWGVDDPLSDAEHQEPSVIDDIRERLNTYAPGNAPAGFGPSWNDLRALLAEVERLRAALDAIHDRLDYAGAYREGAYLHRLWRTADEALWFPGRRR